MAEHTEKEKIQIVAGLVLGVVIAAIFIALNSESGWYQKARRESIRGEKSEMFGGPSPASHSTPQVITLDEFQRVQIGMSYAELKRIVGVSGTLASESALGNPGDQIYVHTVAYTFKNPDGGNATIMLQNDAVRSKTQFGLQ